MDKTPDTKPFDCMAFKRRVQEEIYAETQGLSASQQVEYFRRHAATGPLGLWWQSLRTQASPAAVNTASRTP